MTQYRILVIGGSGTVGAELSKRLSDDGYSIRVTTSKKSPPTAGGHVDQVHLDLLTGAGIANAFDGVDRAFLMAPGGYADQFSILAPLIQEAKNKRLDKVVLMTAMGVEANAAGPYRRAEVELEQSGLAYNIVRPNWFMQNFNTFWIQGIREQGKILVPGGNAKVSFVDARDIAAVVARLLTTDDRNNHAFTLTGPDALDHDEVAAALSRATSRPISYQNIEPAALKHALLAAGLSEAFSEFLLEILGFLRQGYNAAVTSDVQMILGRAPTGIKKYAEDYKSSWL
jgi:uncharacterized protein YbjT (DUF2867 family)